MVSNIVAYYCKDMANMGNPGGVQKTLLRDALYNVDNKIYIALNLSGIVERMRLHLKQNLLLDVLIIIR